MDDLLSFLRSAELGTLVLIAAGLVVSWARLFPDLRGAGTPRGIVDLELPGTTDRAQDIVAAWQARRLESAARRSVTLDWFFIPMYVVLLACAGVLAARAGEALGGLEAGDAETIAAVLVVAAVVAGVLDVLEDVGIKLMLAGHVGQPIPLATTVTAAVKWFLLLVLVASLVAVPLYGLLA